MGHLHKSIRAKEGKLLRDRRIFFGPPTETKELLFLSNGIIGSTYTHARSSKRNSIRPYSSHFILPPVTHETVYRDRNKSNKTNRGGALTNERTNEFRHVTFLRTLVAFALCIVETATLEFNIRHTTSWGKLDAHRFKF